MGTRDYVAWHDAYEQPGSRLHLRLLVVQDLLARALDELPPGPVRLVSMCAGQGRDVIGTVRRHRRGADVAGRLVELDPDNVRIARREIESASLRGLAVVEGDAGVSDSYAGAAPADLVVACGVFGNVPDADIRRTISFLPSLCAPGAWLVWTRHPLPDGIIGSIGGWLAEAGFEARAVVVPEGGPFGVGAAVFCGEPRPFVEGVRLFRFTR